ncbi:hypothetical protein Tco_0083720 [Tanacetum coccineum]
MTTVVASTVDADTFYVPMPWADHEPVYHTLFADSASIGEANPDIAGPSHPASTELSANSFFVSQELDLETLHQTYVPKYNVTNDSALDEPDVCHRLIDHLAPLVLFSQLCSMDYDQLLVEFNVGAARQTCLSSKVRLLLEHDLRDKKKLEGKCNWQAVAELNGLKEQNSALDEEKNVLVGKVTALESVNATKMTELASLTAQTTKLTQDLSELDLSCDELSVKASSPEAERDKLIGQVSLLEGTCSKLRDEVSGYLVALRGAIGRVIDKGMQDRLVAGIDHGKAGRGLADVAAYDPFVEANYVSAVNALRAMDFLLLAQLESQKDASIADIMGLLHLEGPTAEAPEASHLKPSPEQLMLPIHRPEDQVVIGETSLSFSLDVVYAHV